MTKITTVVSRGERGRVRVTDSKGAQGKYENKGGKKETKGIVL